MPSFLKKKKNTVILICLVLFQLVVISFQVPLGAEASFFEKAVFSLFSPLQNGVTTVIHGVGKAWKGYFDLRNVHRENTKIKQEIFFLQLENRLLRGFLNKANTEQEIRDLLEQIRGRIVIARVIEMDIVNPYNSVVINRGWMDGIEKDMFVLDRFGQLVGRIISPVTPREAKLQLITATDSGTGVFNQSKVPGVINGSQDGLCVLKYIVQTEKGIDEGDVLSTSGFDKLYPPGIPVGEVISVNPTEELFKQIIVRPFFQIRHLDALAVIKLDSQSFF
jgi:rod shape-determining protein MreC